MLDTELATTREEHTSSKLVSKTCKRCLALRNKKHGPKDIERQASIAKTFKCIIVQRHATSTQIGLDASLHQKDMQASTFFTAVRHT